MYFENGVYELTHSFRISCLTSLEQLKIESGDYWGINTSKYEFCYQIEEKLKENKIRKKMEKLTNFRDSTVDKCLGDIGISTAILYLIKDGSKLSTEDKKEDKKEAVETKFDDLTAAAKKEDLVKREKILCMYHGLNVIQNK